MVTQDKRRKGGRPTQSPGFRWSGPGARKARETAGLTQLEVAARIGVHVLTYARWESGRRAPSRRHARDVARTLGVTPKELTR